MTVLRIMAADGKTTRLICGRSAPATLTAEEASARGYDWWFTSEPNPSSPPDPSSVTQHIYINPNGGCLANPGETYSAEYLLRLPPDGCLTDADCKAALGGSGDCSEGSTTCPWMCYAPGATNTCASMPLSSPGTCVCGPRSNNCPDG